MKLLILAITLFGLQAQADDIEYYTEVQSAELRDTTLVSLQYLASDLISTHKLSRHPNSCGEVMTFRGPTDPQSAKNLQLWIKGIGNEMAAVNQDEDVKLRAIDLSYRSVHQKVMLLADRNSQYFDATGVEDLSSALFNEIQKNPKDYYLLFGDYLDGKTGWMTTVTLVKLSSGEALLIANTNDCF